eukprot:UC1_evm1s463
MLVSVMVYAIAVALSATSIQARPVATPTSELRRIFLNTEKFGFNIPDFHGLPTNIGTHFDVGAVVPPLMEPQPFVNTLNEGCKLLASQGVKLCEHWADIYMGSDSAQNPACHSANAGASVASCVAQVDQLMSTIGSAPYNVELSGLWVDNEGATPDIFVPALEQLRSKYPKLKLASTRTFQDIAIDVPHNAPAGSAPWDFAAGQFYTVGDNVKVNKFFGTKTNFYPGNCNIAPNFYNFLSQNYGGTSLTTPPGKSFWSSYRVPMFCGAGNCQDYDTVDDIGTVKCLDNRLGPSQLEALIDSQPAQGNLKNFAVWYGTLPTQDRGCGAHVVGQDTCVPGLWNMA